MNEMSCIKMFTDIRIWMKDGCMWKAMLTRFQIFKNFYRPFETEGRKRFENDTKMVMQSIVCKVHVIAFCCRLVFCSSAFNLEYSTLKTLR